MTYILIFNKTSIPILKTKAVFRNTEQIIEFLKKNSNSDFERRVGELLCKLVSPKSLSPQLSDNLKTLLSLGAYISCNGTLLIHKYKSVRFELKLTNFVKPIFIGCFHLDPYKKSRKMAWFNFVKATEYPEGIYQNFILQVLVQSGGDLNQVINDVSEVLLSYDIKTKVITGQEWFLDNFLK